ncbi:MAG: putative capsid scaffold protein [Caudoviricetes sp.]|nr:MAG: putative capsid scaffold protein [Caudoviricetes sp.]
MTNQIKTEKRSSIVADLAASMATDKGSKAFKALIASRIDIDAESGKVTYLNEDGSASSLDLAGFKAELMKDDSLSPLLKADIVTNGGGNLNGNNDGSASVKTMKREQFDQLSDKNKMEFVKTGGKIN